MNLNVLRYVEAVAAEQNFTRAAAKLYVAQPSLSQAIRALERELGTALFNRDGRAITLTPAGERYVNWAKTVLRSEEKLRSELQSAPGGLRKLVIGASPYRCKALFPRAIKTFYERYPSCRIELRDQYQNDAMRLLDEEKIDILIDLPPAGGYLTEYIVKERILVAIPKSFPVKLLPGERYPRVALRELFQYPVLMIDDMQYPSPLHLGPVLLKLYDEADAVPDIALRCCGAETAHILAAQGLGFTVISELFMRENPMEGLVYCEIDGHSLTREVCAICSTARPFSKEGLAFIELLKGWPEDHSPDIGAGSGKPLA